MDHRGHRLEILRIKANRRKDLCYHVSLLFKDQDHEYLYDFSEATAIRQATDDFVVKTMEIRTSEMGYRVQIAFADGGDLSFTCKDYKDKIVQSKGSV